ncbi:MAG: ABC transporter ATP-binding protein [Phycisphaerae bacterium]
MVLSIEDLRIDLRSGDARTPVVDGISLQVDRGEIVALVGESGCGKSITSLAILRLLPDAASVTGGCVRLDGRDLLQLPESALRDVRGNRIGMIFQEPMSSLNPLITIGDQIGETLRLHRGMGARAARGRGIELLERVKIPAAASRVDDYPHQLSGGMRQRVMIAMALACEPMLLIADEPTTALDVTVQAQIVELLREIQRAMGLAVLFITHDLALVSSIADRVYVMYAGRVVEQARATELFARPRHPYTQALLRSLPRMEERRSAGPLPVIPGEVPRPWRRPGGCAFHTRCDVAQGDEQCRSETPALRGVEVEQWCACWKA